MKLQLITHSACFSDQCFSDHVNRNVFGRVAVWELVAPDSTGFSAGDNDGGVVCSVTLSCSKSEDFRQLTSLSRRI